MIVPIRLTVVCEECSIEDRDDGNKRLIIMEPIGPLTATPDNSVQTQMYFCPLCSKEVSVTMLIQKPS